MLRKTKHARQRCRIRRISDIEITDVVLHGRIRHIDDQCWRAKKGRISVVVRWDDGVIVTVYREYTHKEQRRIK